MILKARAIKEKIDKLAFIKKFFKFCSVKICVKKMKR